MKHVGTVGQKIHLFVKCIKAHAYPGQYGYTYVNTCVDRYGNKIIYKGSKPWIADHYYSFDATVKDHSVWKDEPQTYVTRPKVEKVKSPDGNEVKL